MADRKTLFVNANGDYEEVSTSNSDSITAFSFKTATYELTDALLGQLTNDVILRQGTRAFTGDQSHGGFKITNLANGTAASDAINFGQLTSAVNGLDWKESVKAATTAALPAVTYANGTAGVGATLTADANGALGAQDGITLIVGDRLLVKNQAGLQNGIYTVTDVGGAGPFVLTRALDYDSSTGTDPEVSDGNTVTVEQGTLYFDRAFKLTTSDPITMGTTALTFAPFIVNTLTGGAGITMTAEVVSADLLSSGGLKFVGAGDAGQIAVEPADFAGDGLVDDGSDNLAIDWASVFTIGAADAKAVRASDLANTNSGFGASIIGIRDIGNYTSVNNVEAALQELYAASGQFLYTVGAGGVTKGDLVYLTANNTVTSMPINANHVAVGVALATVSAAGQVAIQAEDYIIPGAVSGATFGTKYYWNGTALTTTIPAGAGNMVWMAGTAINATDLLVSLEFVKKNAA